MPLSQHKNQDPGTEGAKWNSAVINFIIYACAFPPAPCQNVRSQRALCIFGWTVTLTAYHTINSALQQHYIKAKIAAYTPYCVIIP